MKDELTSIIAKLLNSFKKRVCSHEFRLSDMKLTGIPELEKPKDNDITGWHKYYRDIYDHDSNKKRVSLPCCKCGQMFYDECGLYIIWKGKVIPDKEKTIECDGCGKCCQLLDPYLEVELGETDFIPASFIEYKNDKRYMKRQSDENKSCIALKDNRCSIYAIRPKECRDFNQHHPLCKKIITKGK